jgi:hypothetical protein
MRQIVPSGPAHTTTVQEEDEANPHLIERLVSFLDDWLHQYRTDDGPVMEPFDPRELTIVRQAGNALRKRKPRSIALDDWARRTYSERRLRDGIFADPQLFGEPAWDMLLDIALAEAKGERLSVTSVCIGSCVPLTTALRWLSILEDSDLVRRELDSEDGRRFFVRLTPGGIRKFFCYFEGVRESRRMQI